MRKRSFKRPKPITFQSRRISWQFVFNAALGLGGSYVPPSNLRFNRHGKFTGGARPIYKFDTRAGCELMMSFCQTHGITAFWKYADNTIEFLGGYLP